ncbi:unnamed protein product, partial [Urochloa humidicola]
GWRRAEGDATDGGCRLPGWGRDGVAAGKEIAVTAGNSRRPIGGEIGARWPVQQGVGGRPAG